MRQSVLVRRAASWVSDVAVNGNSIRVLVVEDEAPHAELIRRAFEYRAGLLLEEEEASPESEVASCKPRIQSERPLYHRRGLGAGGLP